MRKKYTAATLAVACLAGFFVSALIGALFFYFKFGNLDVYGEAVKYATVRRIVSDEYIGDVDPEAIDNAVFSALIDTTGDRWSYYMGKLAYEEYKNYSENRYIGIGVTIQKDETADGLVIVAVAPGGPAEAAGIMPGHIILAVDGISMAGRDASEARVIIHEKFESEIALSVLFEDGTIKDVTVTSEIIYNDPVRWEMIGESIGYISISNFEAGSADGAIAAISELCGEGAKALVFDVRNNPGGKLSEMLSLVDHLLPEGEIFVSASKNGKEDVHSSGPECVEMPMAVLINKNSYSAAEFFAAVLREYDWAVIVGEQSTGKNRVQMTFELSDGSAVHLSTKKYLTPARVDLSAVGGLAPDIVQILTEGFDNQLKAAAEHLSELVKAS